jgi:hypothetical protein
LKTNSELFGFLCIITGLLMKGFSVAWAFYSFFIEKWMLSETERYSMHKDFMSFTDEN